MNESYEEKIKRLRPIDDDFFKIYIHPIEIVKVIVEAILHKDVIISGYVMHEYRGYVSSNTKRKS